MGRKLNIYPVFLFLNFTHHFIMKIPNKQVLQQVSFSHLSDIEFKDFLNAYIK